MPQIASRKALIGGAAAAIFTALSSAPAAAYDMDCKLILCLAGGFPSGCADAKAYMMSRITRVHPLPPIGFCAMSNGAEYANYEAPYAFLRRESAEGYACRDGKRLYFRHDADRGAGEITAFCYDHAVTRVTTGYEGGDTVTVYEGQSAAIPMHFRIRITVEPGADVEYRSPTYRISFGSGYVLAE